MQEIQEAESIKRAEFNKAGIVYEVLAVVYKV